jgi:starch phosphorylase
MVREYTERAYVPNGQRYLALVADNGAEGRTFLDWKNRVRAAWPDVKLVNGRLTEREVGLLEASVDVHLGNTITGDDVTVSVIIGIETDGALGTDAVRSDVGELVSTGNGWYRWTGQLAWTLAGPTGARFRMDPSHARAESPIELPLIRWD